MLATVLGIVYCASWVCGCEKTNIPETNVPLLKTNKLGLVSIGVLNIRNNNDEKAIMHFFSTNGVGIGIEGSVMFDVMVRANDVERVHMILHTNRPPGVDFKSVWESRPNLEE